MAVLVIKGWVGWVQDCPRYCSSQTLSRDLMRTFPVQLGEINKVLFSLMLINFVGTYFKPVEVFWRHFKHKHADNHRQTWDSLQSTNPATPPPTPPPLPLCCDQVCIMSVMFSNRFYRTDGLTAVPSCVSWFLSFRVRRPPPAGHAESHGEEEAGLHPRAHRHRGELRQRSSARHRGEQARVNSSLGRFQQLLSVKRDELHAGIICRFSTNLCWSVSCWRRRKWPWSSSTGRSSSCATLNCSSNCRIAGRNRGKVRDSPPHARVSPHRALRVRKKMSGDRMPVKMIGDILTNQLPHMQPYIRSHLQSPKTRRVFIIISSQTFIVCADSVRVSWMAPRWFSRKLTTTPTSKTSSRCQTHDHTYWRC